VHLAIEAYAHAEGIQPPLATWEEDWTGGAKLSLVIDHAARGILEGALRWRVGVRAAGFAPAWGQASTDGHLRFSKAIRLGAGVVPTFGQVLLADGTPRPFTTIWADAEGTVLGWCDGQGRFEVGVPKRGGGDSAFVIYEKDLIGGWYTTAPGHDRDHPLVCQPRSALSARVRLLDAYGTPIPHVGIRGGGGGGTSTDEQGIAEVASLFANRATPLIISAESLATRTVVVQFDAHRPEIRAAVTDFTIDIGFDLVYQPRHGDMVFRTAEGSAEYADGAVVVRQGDGWLARCDAAGLRDQPLRQWVAAAPQQRFDAYRLATPDQGALDALLRPAPPRAAPSAATAATAWIADWHPGLAGATPDALACSPLLQRVCGLVRPLTAGPPSGF